MSCGSGCTDCPTCRGEVQPDAPVMDDMRFAMAMDRGAMTWDPVLSPLSVAQTVRDGVRLRGASSVSDAQMMEFIRAEQHLANRPVPESVAGLDMFDDQPVQPPPGPAPDPTPGTPTVLTADQLKQLKRIETSGTVEARTRAAKRIISLETVAEIKGRVVKKHGNGAEPYCDVEYFRFPASFWKTYDKRTGILWIAYMVKAKYKNSGGSAQAPREGGDGQGGEPGAGDDGQGSAKVMVPDCACCEYNQYVNAGAGGEYIRECYLIDQVTGQTRRTTDGGRNGTPAEPTPSEMMVCPGDQVKTEDLKARLSKAGMELNLETDGCLLKWVDSTGSRGRFGRPGFAEYDFAFLGLIEDRCVPPEIRAVESFRIQFSIATADMDPSKPWSAPDSKLTRTPLVGLSGGNTGEKQPTESPASER